MARVAWAATRARCYATGTAEPDPNEPPDRRDPPETTTLSPRSRGPRRRPGATSPEASAGRSNAQRTMCGVLRERSQCRNEQRWPVRLLLEAECKLEETCWTCRTTSSQPTTSRATPPRPVDATRDVVRGTATARTGVRQVHLLALSSTLRPAGMDLQPVDANRRLPWHGLEPLPIAPADWLMVVRTDLGEGDLSAYHHCCAYGPIATTALRTEPLNDVRGVLRRCRMQRPARSSSTFTCDEQALAAPIGFALADRS